MSNDFAYIKSEGDLEVVTLYEMHSSLATIIGPNLYKVLGQPPNQNILFNNDSSFDLFLILSAELFFEGDRSIKIGNKSLNISLFESMKTLMKRHPLETKNSGIEVAYDELNNWINDEVNFEFWCGSLSVQIKFPLPNRRLLWFASNTAKHNLLRLSKLLQELQKYCKKGGYSFSSQEMVAMLEEFEGEIRNRLRYHSSYLIEMLGKLFKTINNLILKRYRKNPTNKVKEMIMPEGISSDVFCDLYGSVLVFKQYSLERIIKFTPRTSRYLKLRYSNLKI